MKINSLRWLGFISCIIIIMFMIVLIPIEISHDTSTPYTDAMWFSVMAILPALIASLFSLFKKYWALLFFGLWYLFGGFLLVIEFYLIEQSLVIILGIIFLIIPALSLFFIPFVNKALSKEQDIKS